MELPDWAFENMRNRQFELGATMPLAWAFRSSQLKRAADYLFAIYFTASKREMARFVAEVNSSREEATTGVRELKGDELEDSRDAQLVQVYVFLAGLSLETLCKAILVIRKQIAPTPGGKLTGFKSHNLIGLFRRCEIPFTEAERLLLSVLTSYAEWSGKYPVPLSREDMWPIKTATGWELGDLPFQGEELKRALDDLYGKAASLYLALRAANEENPRTTTT